MMKRRMLVEVIRAGTTVLEPNWLEKTPNDGDALFPSVVGETPGLPHIVIEPLKLGFDLPVWLARHCDGAA